MEIIDRLTVIVRIIDERRQSIVSGSVDGLFLRRISESE